MALIVKYKFQNVDANGNSVTLLPQFPSGVSYTKTDVVEGNITTRVIETDDLSKVTYIRFGCNVDAYTIGAWEYLTEILDINISYVNTCFRMFRGCKLLNSIDVSNWNTSKVTNMASMFDSCSQLAQLDVSKWVTSSVIYMGWMFNGCNKLTSLDVSNWDTRNVTDMRNTFYNCSQLTQLDVSNFDTSKVTSMENMFRGCSKLTHLDVSNFDTSKVNNTINMFVDCQVKNVGLIYCSKDTIDKLANCITSPCNFYVTNKTYTSPNPLVKYVMYREDKKPLLYYNDETQSWEKPILRQWDSIEKHSDGKYYYHKRSKELVLTGSEKISTDATNNVNTQVFSFSINTSDRKNIAHSINQRNIAICNNFSTNYTADEVWHIDNIECISITEKPRIRISKSKASTVEEFKTWVQANPTTVVYQLAEEKVYECTNLDLITYSGETNLMVGSRTIVPKTTLKIHQNIANITTVLQEKVSILENDTNTINSEINTINSNTNTINSEINTINSNINTINSNINTMNSNINTMSTEVDNINTDLVGVSESIEGSWISVDSKDGYLKDIEILGNTVQNQNDLADIRSVGDKLENQELYEIPVLITGKNLFNKNDALKLGYYYSATGAIEGSGLLSDSNKNFISEKYFKITSDTITWSGIGGTVIHPLGLCFYDKDKNFINRYETTNIINYTVPSNAEYFRIKGDYNRIDYLQLEFGAKTEYQEYKEHKLTILSPTPLEKVGDIADRIICKDGVWGVEKNIATITFNGSETWYYDKVTKGYYATIPNLIKDATIPITNRYLGVPIISSSGQCHLGGDIGNKNGNLVINHDDGVMGSTAFREYVTSNNITVKYPTSEIQFIHLPYDQQVKLRTFANKTNISFGCEIEPTLKASVPKSIGATVNSHTEQIDNLGKELDKVKKLEESTVSTVTTESDFISVENTHNGYFEDVKIEGRTLVNLIDVSDWLAKETTITATGAIVVNTKYINSRISKTVKAGDKVTLIPRFSYSMVSGSRPPYMQINYKATNGTEKMLYHISNIDNSPRLLTIPEDFLEFHSIFVATYQNTSINFKNDGIVLLEGDHTQNPPSYFEGIKSVGQDVDEISVLSCNENLFDELAPITRGYVYTPTGDIIVDGDGVTTGNATTDYIYIGGLNKLNIGFEEPTSFRYSFYDINKKFIKGELVSTNSNMLFAELDVANIYYVRISTGYYDSNTDNFKGLMITVDKPKYYNYIPHKQDKKRILYYNDETQTWEKPVLREWDSIEKHSDGKYYYHKRSGEVVLNGKEFWELRPVSDSQDVISFNGSGLKTSSNVLGVVCDKFITMNAFGEDSNFENIFIATSTRMQVRILKSKLSTQDVAGFKAWLQANPTTVVYQLAEEKVYECTNLDLITYSGETNLLVKSGVLNPKVTLKIHQNITNIITILQNKVSVLENVFIQGLKQVLAGDMQSLAYTLYPEDFENIEQSIDETSLGEQQDDPTDK